MVMIRCPLFVLRDSARSFPAARRLEADRPRPTTYRFGGEPAAPDGRLVRLTYGPRMTVDMLASNDASPALRSRRIRQRTKRKRCRKRRSRPTEVAFDHRAARSVVDYMTLIATGLDVSRDLRSRRTPSQRRHLKISQTEPTAENSIRITNIVYLILNYLRL